MFFPIAGIVLVGAAVGMSRRPVRTLGGLGAASMGVHTAEALAAVQRAAGRLYGPVDRPRAGPMDLFWEDPDYEPACPAFTPDALEALKHARIAEETGEPEAYSAKVAAIQAWSLSQVECGGDSPEWAEEQSVRPVVPR